MSLLTAGTSHGLSESEAIGVQYREAGSPTFRTVTR